MPPRPVQLKALTKLLPRASTHVERSLFLQLPSLHHSQPQTIAPRRPFSSTPISRKKKGRAEREVEESTKPSKSAAVEIEDPFDFTVLEADLVKNLEKLKNDLTKLRTGGRFNPEALEGLRVVLSSDGKGVTERLGDLAQVLPKGRNLQILVGDKDHVKAIVSAIQSSREMNLQPQPDATNALHLNIIVPGPTKESRDIAIAAASKLGEAANMGVRNARAVIHKKLRGMEVKKVARGDDLRKAHKEMEKIVEKGMGDVKKIVETAKKGMEQA